MPRATDDEEQPEQAQEFELQLDDGVNTDSVATQVKVVDSNNCELMPGVGLVNRRGSVIYQRFEPKLPEAQAGRMALLWYDRVPNLSDGTGLAVIVNTGKNNRVEAMNTGKPKTSRAGGAISAVYLDDASYWVDSFETVEVTVLRTGELSRTATVDWSTADGTAVSPTNYTAASGTVTFNPGETSKTFPVETDYAGSGNPYFTITLHNPQGCVLATPNATTVSILQPIMITSAAMFNDYTYVYGIDTFTGTVYAYYLTRLGAVTVPSELGSGHSVLRVSRDRIMNVWGVSDAFGPDTDATLYVNLYSQNTLTAQGSAYSAGATTKADAIKCLPYASFMIRCSVNDVQNVWIVPYTAQHCLLVGTKYCWVVDLENGVVSASWPTPDAFGAPWGNDGTLAGAWWTKPMIDSEGKLIVFVSHNTAERVNAWLRLEPLTGELLASMQHSVTITDQGATAALSSGRFVVFDGGKIWAIDNALTTVEDMGSFSIYGQRVCANELDQVFVVDSADSNQLKQIQIGEVGTGTHSVLNTASTSDFLFDNTYSSWCLEGAGLVWTRGYDGVRGEMRRLAFDSGVTVFDIVQEVDAYSAEDYDDHFTAYNNLGVTGGPCRDATLYSVHKISGTLR